MKFLKKTMEKLRKNKDIKLVTTEIIKNYLISELNYHTTKFFTEYLLAKEMKNKNKKKKLKYL